LSNQGAVNQRETHPLTFLGGTRVPEKKGPHQKPAENSNLQRVWGVAQKGRKRKSATPLPRPGRGP